MKYQKINKIFVLSFVFAFFLLGNFIKVQAQAVPEIINSQFSVAVKETKLTEQDPRYIAVTIIRVALGLLGIIFFAQVVYAGFLWMTAGGDEKKVETAQKYIKNGVIGLVVILISYSIVLIVTVYALRGTVSPRGAPERLPGGYPQF